MKLIFPPRSMNLSRSRFTLSVTFLTALLCLLGLQIFSGCENDNTTTSPQTDPVGFGMNLIMPPAGVWPDPALPADTTKAEIYRLGTADDSPFTQRPVAFDPTSEEVPFATGFSVGGTEFTLDITGELTDTWFRLFVKAGDFRGESTFKIDDDDTVREVYVALAPATASNYQLVVYDGLPVSSLAPIAQGVFAAADDKASFTLFPVALANPASIEAMEFIFCLDNVSEAEIYIDPGSRLFSSGNTDDFLVELINSELTSPNGNTYIFEIEPTDGLGSGALIPAGSGILFYILATADSASTSICLDQASALFQRPGSDPFGPDISEANACSFPVGLTIDVTSPTAGETACAGFPATISWTLAAGWDNSVIIELLLDEEVCGNPINTGTESGVRSFDWIAAQCGEATGLYRIRLTPIGDIGFGGDELAVSERFTILSGCDLTLSVPNGGESYVTGEEVPITWQANECCGDSVAIVLYSCDEQCSIITTGTPNDGAYTWFAAACAGSACDYIIGIHSLDGTVLDKSDEEFVIENACTIRVTSPAALDIWVSGQEFEIVWTSQEACGDKVDIFLFRSGASCLQIADGIDNDGSYKWIAAQCDGEASNYRIRVIDQTSAATGVSEGQFRILDPCAITLNSPNGGEDWTAETGYQIEWSSTDGCGGSVQIDLLNDGAVCQSIATSAPNTGTYSWVAAQCESNVAGYSVRIKDIDSGVEDISDENFSINPYLPPCVITVTSPNGGEVLSVGQTAQITWDSEETCAAQVRIVLVRDDQFCFLIDPEAENTGTYYWPVSQCDESTDLYQIYVTDMQNNVTDGSDESFQISPACMITLISPEAGASWCIGETGTITWTVFNCDEGTLSIDLLQSNELCREIATVPVMNGTYDWGVVPCEGDSSYTIWIREDDGFSEIISGEFTISDNCALALTSLNDGGTYCEGDSIEISWTAGPCCGESVEVILNHLGSPCLVLSEAAASPGSVTWVAEQCNGASDDYTIVLTDLAEQITVESALSFTINPCTLELTNPTTGDEVCEGETVSITWNASTCCGEFISLELYNSSAGDCAVIAQAASSAGTFDWVVAGCGAGMTSGYRIKASNLDSLGEPVLSVYSEGEFSILTDCVMTLEYPIGGEQFAIGDTVPIAWDKSICCGEQVSIILFDSDSGARRFIAETTASDGSYDWIAWQIALATDNYFIEIVDLDTEATISHDLAFTIIHPCLIDLLTSLADEDLCVDQAVLLEWDAVDCDGLNAVIELWLDDGVYTESIANVSATEGAYSWLPAQINETTGGYSLNIQPSQPGAGDISEGYFDIHPGCDLSIVYPNDESGICESEEITIEWTRGPCCGTNVSIDLYHTDSWCGTIATSVADATSYSWVVTPCLEEDLLGYKIRITDTSSLAYTQSAVAFNVRRGGEIYSPSAGDEYFPGEDITIQWSAPCTDSPIQIELYNYMISDSDPCVIIATSAPNTGSYLWTAAQCGEEPDDYAIAIRDAVTGDELGFSNGTFAISSFVPTIWTVRDDGTGDVPTIQAAIDIAATGDIVRLANGWFVGPGNRDLHFNGKAITLESAGGDPLYCIIDCAGDFTGISFLDGETATTVVQNIRITRANGSGIICSDASPTIRGCVFDYCAASAGGGISCTFSSPTIQNCTFYRCDGNPGSAIYAAAGSFPVVTNSIMSEGFSGSANETDGAGSIISLTCCCIWDVHKAEPKPMSRDGNNFSADPLMCWPSDGGQGFRLDYDSPCTAANAPVGCGRIGACFEGCPGK